MLAEDSIEIKIVEILNASVESMGYEIVRIRLQGSGGNGKHGKTLQIMIDRADGEPIHVDDCETVSKHVSALLDVEDPIVEAYNLEVSSPGLDRPLTRPKDFINFSGFEAKLETRDKVNGQRRFRGKLQGMEAGEVLVDLNIVDIANPGQPNIVKVNFDNIKSAKLIITDELLAKYSGDRY